MAEYEKLKRITFPLKDKKLIYLTAELEVDHDTLIKNMLKIIEKF